MGDPTCHPYLFLERQWAQRNYRHIGYCFNQWSQDGTWERINAELRHAVRRAAGKDPEPRAAILDSQSVKRAKVVARRALMPIRKSKGENAIFWWTPWACCWGWGSVRRRFKIVEGGKTLLGTLKTVLAQLQKVWADEGYKRWWVEWVQQACAFALDIIKKAEDQVGFQMLPQRWKVERSLAWLNRNRRLSKDCEHHTKSSKSMVYLASLRLMLRRLAVAVG